MLKAACNVKKEAQGVYDAEDWCSWRRSHRKS